MNSTTVSLKHLKENICLSLEWSSDQISKEQSILYKLWRKT